MDGVGMPSSQKGAQYPAWSGWAVSVADSALADYGRFWETGSVFFPRATAPPHTTHTHTHPNFIFHALVAFRAPSVLPRGRPTGSAWLPPFPAGRAMRFAPAFAPDGRRRTHFLRCRRVLCVGFGCDFANSNRNVGPGDLAVGVS